MLHYRWLNSSAVPRESALFSYSLAAKSFWLNKESFVPIDGVLYENELISGDKKLVVSKSLAVQCCHDLQLAGLQERRCTKQRVNEKYSWYGLSKFIEQYVAGCEICNKCKKSDREDKCPLTEYQAGHP